MTAERFKIAFPQAQLDDLYYRLNAIRWPTPPEDAGWDRGMEQNTLHQLVEYWKHDFDWRKQEETLNQFSHYRCRIAGTDIHFIHERGQGRNPIPLILTHGWPDSFLRYQKIIPMLTDPARYGGDPDDAFDVVIPSVPGFGLSGSAVPNGLNNAGVAKRWHSLMTQELGYTRFYAGGGDVGSSVTRYLALHHPDSLIGIHLTDIGIVRNLLACRDEQALTEEEKCYRNAALAWMNSEGAYMSLQATKPRTLAWALNDSPVGLASWILEKFMSWGDCRGDLWSRFSKDELLTNIMLYWLTGTAGSAAGIYYENMHTLPPMGNITVPTGVALFAADILPPPKSWAEKNLNIVHWNEIPCGGHFTAMEEPERFVADIRQFARTLR